MLLSIEGTWDGEPVGPGESARIELALDAGHLILRVDAPFHNDPVPPGPPGPTDGLWDFEVAEVFLAGREDRYLEVELGPHGHHLALELHGERNVVRRGLPLRYEASIDGRCWRGIAWIPLAWLPPGLDRVNGYAIHGTGSSRRYLAAFPVPGERPDFHRLDRFGALALRQLPSSASVPSRKPH